MSEQNHQRVIVRIQIDAEAKKDLDQLCERRGMTQIATMSRLVAWFVRQNDVIQAAILGGLSERDAGELATILLNRMANKSNGSGQL